MHFGSKIEIFVVDQKGGMSSLPVTNDDYLETLREFIDFINRQVGVYMDAITGFAGNKVRIEFQVARVHRRSKPQMMADGTSVVVGTSLEDPSRPDVIHQRIMRASDYLEQNSEGGLNEQHQARAIIVLLFAYWDEEIRPRLARAKNITPNDIRVDAFGDLRQLRNAIIHNKGILSVSSHRKLKIMQDSFSSNTEISISHEKMHQVFVRIKQGISQLIVDHVGKRPGTPNPNEIKDVAIQRLGKRQSKD